MNLLNENTEINTNFTTRKLDDKKGEKSQDTAILTRELEGGFLN